MKRSTAGNEFVDALTLSGMSFAEAVVVLERSLSTIQAYASGTRRVPPEVVQRLKELWWDAVFGDGMTDRYGVTIPEGALRVRRAIRNGSAAGPFEILKAMQREQADPDAIGAEDDGLPPPEEGSDR